MEENPDGICTDDPGDTAPGDLRTGINCTRV